MQITRAADYAVRVMVHMASLPPATRVQRHALAQFSDAPESFLSKVLQGLVASGLLISHRGAGGGFQLAVPAAAVSLLDVVEAVDGPVQLNLCVGHDPSCERQTHCVVHPVWEEAQAALVKVLSGISMARLGRESKLRSAVTPSQPPNGEGPVHDPSKRLA
jgi:Rrf2 family protein